MNYADILAREHSIGLTHAQNIISLIDEGNTIPFIARYRKEMTGSCDDQVLRQFADRLEYLRKLNERKETVAASITEQGMMTDEIAVALAAAATLTEVEDIYRPYKPKRKTRATVAQAKGLSPLADIIFEQNPETGDIAAIAAEYISEEKGVASAQEAIDGAKDIIAERISDDPNTRKILREQMNAEGIIRTSLCKEDEKNKEKIRTFDMYAEFSEPVKKIVSHRILAINRGEKENCIKFSMEIAAELPMNVINKTFVKSSPTSYLVAEAGADAYERLIKPSVDREIWTELFEKASEQAIRMFEVNLRPLLLQPPLKNKVVLGLDPAYRTGCKIAVVDEQGTVLDRAIVYFTPPQNKVAEAKAALTALIKKHKVQVISIGNGTASKESEIFVAELIKELDTGLSYMVVNEAGASVYSASKLGAEEFPDFDVAHRSAASIARRLQDPLAELIKIDPKSIGVGQYQHDMPEKRLDTVLEGVVEDCVNSVGVDLNTASYPLLSHISGLNMSIAKNIVAYRSEKGAFKYREDIKKVPKLGPKAFEQCAGFLRIPGGKNILDNTGVHPESYEATEKLLNLFNLNLSQSGSDTVQRLPELIRNYGEDKVCTACGVGAPTLKDIVAELQKPGRDIRDMLPPPMLRSDIMDISDLKEGMELMGTVRNVIDFGVFVDIGVHQDGLVHISQITDQFIKHPSEVLKVGEVVKVRILSADKAKNRISLTMKGFDSEAAKRAKEMAAGNRDRSRGKEYTDKTRVSEPVKKEQTLEDALRSLQNKFSR